MSSFCILLNRPNWLPDARTPGTKIGASGIKPWQNAKKGGSCQTLSSGTFMGGVREAVHRPYETAEVAHFRFSRRLAPESDAPDGTGWLLPDLGR